jgi:hypothetical protein
MSTLMEHGERHGRELRGGVSGFDLWVATRLADPTFLSIGEDANGNIIDIIANSDMDKDWDAANKMFNGKVVMNLMGTYGVEPSFKRWSGFNYLPYQYVVPGSNKVASLLMEPGFIEEMSHNYEAMAGKYGTKLEHMKMMPIEECVQMGPAAVTIPECSETVMTVATGIFFSSLFTGTCAGGISAKSKSASKVDGVLLSVACEMAQEGKGDPMIRDTFCRGGKSGVPILQPNAFAAFMTKGGSNVLAFQGTKKDDSSMLDYSFKQAPILVMGKMGPSIVPEGYVLYLSQLVDCVLKGSMQVPLNFITGHSLGAAAASIFHDSFDVGKQGKLVTFGAPPTAYAGGAKPAKDMKCYSAMTTVDMGSWVSFDGICQQGPEGSTVTEEGFHIAMSLIKDASYGKDPYCAQSAGSGSLRIFHKFDPVSSSLMWGGQYRHTAETAMMVYDYWTGSCMNGKSGCETGYRAADNKGHQSDFGKWMCGESEYTPSSVYSSCEQNEFSYANLVNPFPCSEVMIAYTYLYLDSKGHTGGMKAPWIPSETFATCSASYIATVDIYAEYFLASDLSGILGDMDAGEAIFFYLSWGLLWVHNTYSAYPLCEDARKAGYGGNSMMDAYTKYDGCNTKECIHGIKSQKYSAHASANPVSAFMDQIDKTVETEGKYTGSYDSIVTDWFIPSASSLKGDKR